MLNFCATKTTSSSWWQITVKRPQNLTIGRVFNENVLDMVEFGVEDYVPMSKFKNKFLLVASHASFLKVLNSAKRNHIKLYKVCF